MELLWFRGMKARLFFFLLCTGPSLNPLWCAALCLSCVTLRVALLLFPLETITWKSIFKPEKQRPIPLAFAPFIPSLLELLFFLNHPKE
uniref:Uncharacterized protein n=1 Tax=Utricularia reniformis TaxID=192314 RepID=A0A1Y0B0R3_9LAMI|nr:hypothetical protein AEK19_MT0784 [Utricularia reniformis]ART31025.1 hypothetical protein AEK19_MT0784 [Utricularia reniformis]